MCTICQAFRPADPDCPYGAATIPLGAARFEGSDAAADRGTSARMAVGDSFTGAIGRSWDHDWIAIDLSAGETYAFEMTGMTLDDPYLYLRDSSGRLLSQNDDHSGLDSLITYTTTRGGRYYIDAAAYGSDTGSYRITVERFEPAPPAKISDLAEYLTDGFWQDRYEEARAFASNVISVDLTALTAAGRTLARYALEAWSSVADLDFVERRNGAQITFDDNDDGAYAYSITSNGRIESSHINVSTWWLSSFGDRIGDYGFQTYIHEIGHALGLGHQGNYNGSAYFGTDESFANDSWQASVMSYFSQSENPNTSADRAYVVTPMMADVMAIRSLYGAATDGLTAGHTVFGRGHNLGDSWLGRVFDAQAGAGGVTDARSVAMTIADEGGWDRLDMSHDAHDQRIDLRQGGISDVFGMRGNLQISFGTLIEVLHAGQGDDQLIGNAVRNRIEGGSGADSIFGAAGDDTLIGGDGGDLLRSMSGDNRLDGGAGWDRLETGSGNDQLIGGAGHDRLRGGAGDDMLNGNLHDDWLEGQDGNDMLRGGFGTDHLSGNHGQDSLHGGAGNDLLAGNIGDDRLFGNEGADTLYGGIGRDTLLGGQGQDELWGGRGADVFRFLSEGGATDTVMDFGNGNDRIELRGAGIDGFDQLDIARRSGFIRIASDTDGDGRDDLMIHLVGDAVPDRDDFIF